MSSKPTTFLGFTLALVVALTLAPAAAQAQTPSRNLAPGFTQLAKSAPVLVMPVDVELFSLSAGGVAEPRADWTTTALGLMQGELRSKSEQLGLNATPIDEAAADEFSEVVGLHAAVARSIALHHSIGGVWKLPTKEEKLDWSFGDAMQPLQQRTNARYGLFVWVRDSYASAERKAAMVAMALLGVSMGGGLQQGYASLVELDTGRVVWFNQLIRGSGDLRDAKSAKESVDALLRGFPPVR